MEMRDYALPASAFHLTYWTQLQCTEGTVSDEPGTRGSKNTQGKGLLQRLCRGVATAALFSVDLNTKNICPNPQGQSAHITEFPLAGILGCSSVEPELLCGWGRGHGKENAQEQHFREASELHLPLRYRNHVGSRPSKLTVA